MGVFFELLVGKTEAGSKGEIEIRAAFGRDGGDDLGKLGALVSFHFLSEKAGITGEADEGDFIVLGELSSEEIEGSTDALGAIMALHRSALIEKNGEAQWSRSIPAKGRSAH